LRTTLIQLRIGASGGESTNVAAHGGCQRAEDLPLARDIGGTCVLDHLVGASTAAPESRPHAKRPPRRAARSCDDVAISRQSGQSVPVRDCKREALDGTDNATPTRR